ncbi:MAG: alpha/beta fold hydrolase [Oscillospiraceae bacterium]
MNIEEFRRKYPLQKMQINGADFTYRYYKNDSSSATLVLLTGGIGLSDLFYSHFDRFARDFSVITFDYHEAYPTLTALADAADVLFEKLGEKVWLVGQSLGGVCAQIFAKLHPENVEGLVLSNTTSLAEDMGGEGLACLENMVAGQKKMRKTLQLIPFGIYKKIIMKSIDKKTEKLPEESGRAFKEMTEIMLEMLTKEHELHMIDMLIDCENHLNMKPSDFDRLRDRVLLILSDDDETFNDECKKSLVKLMPDPKVITDMSGGHLGALMQIDEYAETVTDFILNR